MPANQINVTYNAEMDLFEAVRKHAAMMNLSDAAFTRKCQWHFVWFLEDPEGWLDAHVRLAAKIVADSRGLSENEVLANKYVQYQSYLAQEEIARGRPLRGHDPHTDEGHI